MTDDLTRDVPPVHQTATFDQAYAGISATIDELVASYRRIRAQNAATREIDIAGLVGYLLESPNSRESFVEHYVVAVVRLAEQAEATRDALKAATDRVRAIHEPEQYHDELLPWCTHCNHDDNQRDDVVLWPCPTLRALDGPLPVEQPHGEPPS